MNYEKEMLKLPICQKCSDTKYVKVSRLDTTKLHDVLYYICTQCNFEWEVTIIL